LEDHYFYDYEKMIDDLDFDSLTITQLVIDIEEQFDIMLPPQKISMSEMETFGKIVDLVHKCITSKESR
ncbi:TPA: acyl carrier protein, partial [Streptococcus pneumoniae]